MIYVRVRLSPSHEIWPGLVGLAARVAPMVAWLDARGIEYKFAGLGRQTSFGFPAAHDAMHFKLRWGHGADTTTDYATLREAMVRRAAAPWDRAMAALDLNKSE